MQIATRCMHRTTRSGSPRSDMSLLHESVVGRRRLRTCLPALSPRALARQCHTATAPPQRKLISDSGVLPAQIQQVLRRSAGAGVSMVQLPAGDMRCVVAREAVAQGRASGLRLVPLAPIFDPFRQYQGAQPVAFKLSLQGRQEVHWRTQPLCYTICSDQPWLMLLGGADLVAIEQESLTCAKIAFPANALVQIRLVPGMLHGFEGKLTGVCTAFHRPSLWRWKSSAPLAQEWPASAWVEPGRVRVVADRSIPWELLQHWQGTVATERSPTAIAWEEARLLLLPM